MFGLTPVTLYIIAGLVFTNLLTAFAWQWQRHSTQAEKERVVICQTKFDSFKQQVEVLGKQQEKKVAEVIAASNLAVEETRKKYEANLDRLRADYQRMRQQYASARTSPVPAPDISTRGIDAATENAVSDPVRLATECAETTLNLIWLQEHERQQTKAQEK